jgi:hypothetical protein
LSSTPATTPLPNRIRIAVPITSAPKMLKAAPLPRIAWTQRADLMPNAVPEQPAQPAIQY